MVVLFTNVYLINQDLPVKLSEVSLLSKCEVQSNVLDQTVLTAMGYIHQYPLNLLKKIRKTCKLTDFSFRISDICTNLSVKIKV